jgi:SAM-dependent methyltransferase
MSGESDYVFQTYVVRGLQNRALSERKMQYYAKIWGNTPGVALVIGFATAAELTALRERGHRVVGIDRDAYAVRVGRAAGCEVVRCSADAAHLPFKEYSFDGAFAIHVIEHLVHTDKFVKEIRRILKPRGIVVIETPDYEFCGPKRFYADKTHRTAFTMSSLKLALSTEFELLRIRRICPLFYIWRFTDLAFEIVNPLNMSRISLAGIARKGRTK